MLLLSSCVDCRYNSLIHCCAKNGLGTKALEILREMEEVGVEADLITYNTVCSALAKTGRVDQAAGMLEEMQQRNVAPDVITSALRANEAR